MDCSLAELHWWLAQVEELDARRQEAAAHFTAAALMGLGLTKTPTGDGDD